MRVLLISTYEMGRQPFGLASPAAWLASEGHEVVCVDLCVDKLSAEQISAAELVAFHLPMHTATRLAVPLIEKVRRMNPIAHLCCYGLYAPLNESYLRGLGVKTILQRTHEAARGAGAQEVQRGVVHSGFAPEILTICAHLAMSSFR